MLDTHSAKRFRHALDVKEEDLLLQKAKVRDFLRTDHSSSGTKQFQNFIQDSEAEVDAILASILAEKSPEKHTAQAAKELCQRCRDLQVHVRDMLAALSNDLSDHRHAEEKHAIDVVKNVTFLVGIPGVLSTAARNGVGGTHVNATEAAVAGVGISLTILSRKRIAREFRAAGKSVCELPGHVRNSYALYCARQAIRDGRDVARRIVEAGRKRLAGISGRLNAG